MVAGFATWVNLSESAYFLRMPQPEEDEVVVPVAIAPDLIKIMDLQQEQLARSLRGGHRVIHEFQDNGKPILQIWALFNVGLQILIIFDNRDYSICNRAKEGCH